MAAYFGEGARSRTVLRDEDILNLVQDGNDYDIGELYDGGEKDFDPVLFQDILDKENEYPVSEPETTDSASAQPQSTPTQLIRLSNEVIFQNCSTKRTAAWKQTDFNDKDHNYPCPPSGPVRTPSQYVQDYFYADFFELAAHYSNIYHLRKNGTELKTTPQEIAKLFDIHLTMGVIPYPRLPMYWRSSTKLPLISNSMSRDRFLQLRNSIHVVDFDTTPSRNDNSLLNPLWKV